MISRIQVIFFFISLCGCDFSQPVMNHESQQPIETQSTTQPKAKKIIPPPPSKSLQLKTQPKQGQNPEKSFNDFRRNPVKARAKLPFPPDNLLDR
jgi:hypothetical protein